MHRSKIAAVVIATAIIGASTSGCGQLIDQLGGADAEAVSPAAMPDPILDTTSWGVVDGLLSVVVSNNTDRTLRYSKSVIRALDADGNVVASSLDRGGLGCCEVVDLPPGQPYGLYLDIGADAVGITDVSVSYRSVSWAPVGAPDTTADVSAIPIGLEHGPSGAVAVAALTSVVAHDQVGVQAFLTDATGKLVAVVSGRWTCLAPGTREIRMQLFHAVPVDTVVATVHVHSIGDDPTGQPVECDGSDRL